MASKVQLDLDHRKMNTGFFNGMVMPQCYETAEEHLPKIKAMEIRDDDVMLCSFPKSGEREGGGGGVPFLKSRKSGAGAILFSQVSRKKESRERERERAFAHISSMCPVPNYYLIIFSNNPGGRKRFTIHSMDKITSTLLGDKSYLTVRAITSMSADARLHSQNMLTLSWQGLA